MTLFLFNHPVVPDSLRPHGTQHTRPPCLYDSRSYLLLWRMSLVFVCFSTVRSMLAQLSGEPGVHTQLYGITFLNFQLSVIALTPFPSSAGNLRF